MDRPRALDLTFGQNDRQRLNNIKCLLGEEVRKRREKENLSQSQLALLAGTSQSRISKIEGGESNNSLDNIVLILLSLGSTKEDIAEVLKK